MADLRDVLFHGTSTPRWRSIQQDGRLRLPTSGDRKISLTTDRSVAEYWADLAAWTDRRDRLGDGPGVTLVLSHSALETLLRPFNASTAGDFRGCVIERLDFYIRAGAPNQPKEDRTLPATEIWALRYAHRIAAMERDGFAAADIDHMRATCAKYAPAA